MGLGENETWDIVKNNDFSLGYNYNGNLENRGSFLFHLLKLMYLQSFSIHPKIIFLKQLF